MRHNNKPKIQIQNARVIDPKNALDQQAELYLANGHLVGIGNKPDGFVADQTIDATGCVACPGFIDLSARLEPLEQELKAAIAGGISTLVCPPDTDPPLDEPELVERLVQQAKATDLAQVLPLGALTVNLTGEHLTEMVLLYNAGCIGFSLGNSGINNMLALRRAMEYASSYGYTLWLQPKISTLSDFGLVHDGQVACRLGLPGIPVSAESIAISSILILAAETKTRIHLKHISSAAGMALIEQAQGQGLAVSCDVSVHHLHCSDDDICHFNTMAHLDPPLRSNEDRNALRQGIAKNIATISSGHVPVGEDNKRLPFAKAQAGATALELLLPLTLRWATEEKITLLEALSHITNRPAKVLKSSNALLSDSLGELAIEQPANICVFNPDETWTPDEKSLISYGKNSPFIHHELKGKVKATIINGELK